MVNKLTRKRPNRLLIGRYNYFDKGGDTQQQQPGVLNQAFGTLGQAVTNPGQVFSLTGLGPLALAQGMSSTVGGLGKLGSGLISNGLESTAGSIVGGVGDALSGIPLVGGLAQGALNLVGGGINALFGMKTNKAELERANKGMNALNQATDAASVATSFDDPALQGPAAINFNVNAYKGGLFSSGRARRKNRALAAELRAANDLAVRATDNSIDNIADTQNDLLAANFAALGGPLFAFGGDLMTHGANFDTGITLIGNGNTHEQNPYEGVPMGVDQEGTPNLVEEGEVIFNDYVFSNRLKVPKAVKNKYKLKGKKPITFADAALQMSKESEERPNDPISQAGLKDSMMKLMMAQEQVRTKKNKTNTFAKGGKMGRIYAGELDDPYSQALSLGMGPVNPASTWALNTIPMEKTIQTPPASKNEMGIVLGGYTSSPTVIEPGTSTIPGIIETNNAKYPSPTKTKKGRDTRRELTMSPTWMRYVPAFASGVMSITDALGLTNKPDYTEANAMLRATRGAGKYTPVSFNPIGNYMTYRPFDTDYYTNKLNAESSAARRAILNTSGGNSSQAMAGVLAADYNAQDRMGNLFRQAEEYNLAQRQKVEEFNRGTNMFNSEGIFKADSANQSAQLQSRASYLRGILAAADLRQRERQTSAATRSANLSNFINSVGDIGRENFARNMIVSDPSKYYTYGPDGDITYKNSFYDLSEAEQDYVTGYANRKTKSKKAKDGYLTIKSK